MLITFSGLDGAGKSTLIDYLQGRLEAQRRRTKIFHMNDHIGLYAYLRTVRGWFGGRSPNLGPNGDLAPTQTEPTGLPAAGLAGAYLRVRNALVWSKLLRRLIYPFDLVVFLAYRLYYEKIQGRVLIMDRYFYDTLVDVSDGRRWVWVRLLELITPEPDVPIFIDIGPEEAFARKGEHGLDRLRQRYAAYRSVFPWVRAGVTLVNDDVEITKSSLGRIVEERIAEQ